MGHTGPEYIGEFGRPKNNPKFSIPLGSINNTNRISLFYNKHNSNKTGIISPGLSDVENKSAVPQLNSMPFREETAPGKRWGFIWDEVIGRST